ncbi:hypothetical protein K439DRAFT_411918 [Ramaria rubella]|nr:hypothetical protein K439DRAFT_411918 [Ramaria rubella]
MSPPLTQLAMSIMLLLHHATNATTITPALSPSVLCWLTIVVKIVNPHHFFLPDGTFATTLLSPRFPTLSLHPPPYRCNCYEEQRPAPNDCYHDRSTAHTFFHSTTMLPSSRAFSVAPPTPHCDATRTGDAETVSMMQASR